MGAGFDLGLHDWQDRLVYDWGQHMWYHFTDDIHMKAANNVSWVLHEDTGNLHFNASMMWNDKPLFFLGSGMGIHEVVETETVPGSVYMEMKDMIMYMDGMKTMWMDDMRMGVETGK